MISFATLDFLLEQKNKRVDFQDNEWVWIETINGSDLIVHGSPRYTREAAYEDALRDCLGLIPIADEAIR